MEIKVDEAYILKVMEEIINTPSPVGYYEEANRALEKYLEPFGLVPFYDERHTAYVKFEGEDTSRTVLVDAHMDTLGLCVHHIEQDGSIKLKSLGGNNFHSLEGEKMYLKTMDGRTYTGYITCLSHSVHVFDDARTMERNDENMRLMLDEDVSCAEDVRALGIHNGDVISAEPHFEHMENGRIRSRFIDNKGAVAASLAAIKYLTENHLKPKYNTLFSFNYYEELGFGGGYVPPEVSEYVALDIGVIGPDHDSNEKSVAIIAKDKKGPYDRELTRRLVEKAEKAGINYTVEVFNRYSTDAMAAFVAGNNIKAAAFGMTVYSSHGMERTFDRSIFDTAKLTIAYVLDI